MLYREMIAVCSQIHTKHINTLCGQNVELYIKAQSVPRSKHTIHPPHSPCLHAATFARFQCQQLDEATEMFHSQGSQGLRTIRLGFDAR